MKKKMSETNGDIVNRPPPAGLSEPEDQGDSNACVRYGLSKAIANALFVTEKIDVEQSHITACLVQALAMLDKEYSPLNEMNPEAFDGVKLYLQDKGNKNISQRAKNKAWWKVRFSFYAFFVQYCINFEFFYDINV